MACCGGEKNQDDESNKCGLVPKEERKCRDVFCCLFFIVYWLGMVVVAFLGIQTGKPLSLLFGRDYNGNVCGEGVFVDMKYITYPRMEEDMMNAIINNISPDKVQFFGICVKSCPTTGEKTCTYDDSTCWTTVMDTENVLFRCLPFKSENETIISEECMDPPQAEPSCTLEKYLLKQCDVVCKTKRVKKNVWETSNTNENPLMDQLAGHIQTLGRFISDMSSSSTLILLVGGGGAILLGIIWLVALQFFAGCMIWLTCIFVVLVLVLVSLFCSVRSGIITQDQLQMLSFVNSTSAFSSSDLSVDTGNQVQFKVATYIMWGITGAILLLILAMKKHIHIAIAIIRESSSAIKSMPLLLFWPIIPTILFLGLTAYSVIIAAYLISSDDIAGAFSSVAATAAKNTIDFNSTKIEALPSKTVQQALLAFHTFGFLWTNQLIQAISLCTIAGTVAQYYWTKPNANGHRAISSNFPIAKALGFTLRFHIGSLCFGSFIIAFVQFVRIVLEYIDRNTRDIQQTNKVIKVAFLAVKCCLWCFEKVIKFLSKNAYIIIALKGSSFCSASVESFKIILRNIARMGVVNSISFFLLLLVKITITLVIGLIIFSIICSNPSFLSSTPVTSPMAPVLVSCVLAWLIASAFANVYDACIDTILISFCEDTEMNGEGSSDYMSEELCRIMGGNDEVKRKVIKVSSAPSSTRRESTSPPTLSSPGTNSKIAIDAKRPFQVVQEDNSII